MVLNAGPQRPRMGLTRQNPNASLHGHRLKTKASVDVEDINAPPLSSSDVEQDAENACPSADIAPTQWERPTRPRNDAVFPRQHRHQIKRERSLDENWHKTFPKKKANKMVYGHTLNLHTGPKNEAGSDQSPKKRRKHQKTHRSPEKPKKKSFNVPKGTLNGARDSPPDKKRRAFNVPPTHPHVKDSRSSTRSSRKRKFSAETGDRLFGSPSSSQSNRKPLAEVLSPQNSQNREIASQALLDSRDGGTENIGAAIKRVNDVEVQEAFDKLAKGQEKLLRFPSQRFSNTPTSSMSCPRSSPQSKSYTTTQSTPLSSPPTSPTKIKCQLCKCVVDKSPFEELFGKDRLTVRQQTAFCRTHRVGSARQDWKRSGYPEIDWTNLNRRIEKCHARIEELLQNPRESFYRNALRENVRSGKNRTLKQAVMQHEDMTGLSLGYYGSRGAKLIVDNIIAHFSSKLRRLTQSDRLISTSGVSGYVQAVLAPEVAVMLIMDDMKTDAEGARNILGQSIEMGNLLNEEEDEIIHHDSNPGEV